MRTFWKGFFWGAPSHKSIAWLGASAGVVVLALPVYIARFGKGGHPVFLAMLLFAGLSETGWGVELLPRRHATLAGWGRAARWLCAVMAVVLAVVSLIGQLAPLWFVATILLGALLLVYEMAPSGPANRI